MIRLKTGSNTKYIIGTNWNNVITNQRKIALLKRQGLRYTQNKTNPAIIKIPLITRDTVLESASVGDFILSNMTEELLPFVSVIQKIYREVDSNVGFSLLTFQVYTLNNMTWKYIDSNTILFQFVLPPLDPDGNTFMNLDLYIKNPNVYTALPTYEIQI